MSQRAQDLSVIHVEAAKPEWGAGGAQVGAPIPPVEFAAAKALAIASFERAFLNDLVARCDGNLSRASREAGMARNYLRNLLKKHGLYERCALLAAGPGPASGPRRT